MYFANFVGKRGLKQTLESSNDNLNKLAYLKASFHYLRNMERIVNMITRWGYKF